MAKQKLSRNILPLLAVTALLLSVSLANYNDSVLLGNKSTQSVLSESDENREETENDSKGDRTEKKRIDEKKEVKNRVETKRKVEATRKPENNELRAKEELKVESTNRNQYRLDRNQETESEFEQEGEIKSSDGVVSSFKLKTKSKMINGKTLVETSAGEVEVENSPEEAVNELVADGVIDTPLEFEVKNENDKVEFEFKGVEAKKFLGLFNVNLPKTITVDANTGEVLSNKQTVWAKFLNLLSN